MLKYMLVAPNRAKKSSPIPAVQMTSQPKYLGIAAPRPDISSQSICTRPKGAEICFDQNAAAVSAAANESLPQPGPGLRSSMQATTPKPAVAVSAESTAVMYQVG